MGGSLPSPGAGGQGSQGNSTWFLPCHLSHLRTLPAFLQLLNSFCDTVLHFLVPDRADHQGGFFGGLLLMLLGNCLKKTKPQTQPYLVGTALWEKEVFKRTQGAIHLPTPPPCSKLSVGYYVYYCCLLPSSTSAPATLRGDSPVAASTKEAALRWQHPLLHVWLHGRLMHPCFMTPIFHPVLLAAWTGPVCRNTQVIVPRAWWCKYSPWGGDPWRQG